MKNIIIKNTNLDEFCMVVDIKLIEGWIIEFPFQIHTDDQGFITYYQQMLFYDEEDFCTILKDEGIE